MSIALTVQDIALKRRRKLLRHQLLSHDIKNNISIRVCHSTSEVSVALMTLDQLPAGGVDHFDPISFILHACLHPPSLRQSHQIKNQYGFLKGQDLARFIKY